MAFVHSDAHEPRPVSAKIVVSGGFGVGKTTMVGSVSEIRPLRTEAAMTSAGLAIDDASQIEAKTTTTVAMDFGKLTVEAGLMLYLFGTPGQDRFGFMWDDVVQGALGAIVLVDTRRLDECYGAVDYFESRRMPFVVACNQFDGGVAHDLDEVRVALDVVPEVPIFRTDARDPRMVRDALLILLEHVLARLETPEPAGAFQDATTHQHAPSHSHQPGSPFPAAHRPAPAYPEPHRPEPHHPAPTPATRPAPMPSGTGITRI